MTAEFVYSARHAPSAPTPRTRYFDVLNQRALPAPLAPTTAQVDRKNIRGRGVGGNGTLLLNPGTEAMAVDALRSGRGGRAVSRAQVAMRALLLLLQQHRAEASGGDQVSESGRFAADPLPPCHGPAV